jgi:hypothetical protein
MGAPRLDNQVLAFKKEVSLEYTYIRLDSKSIGRVFPSAMVGRCILGMKVLWRRRTKKLPLRLSKATVEPYRPKGRLRLL